MYHRSHDWGGAASNGEGGADPRDTWDTTGYGQQAGGTHPTGMHSFFLSLFCDICLEN